MLIIKTASQMHVVPQKVLYLILNRYELEAEDISVDTMLMMMMKMARMIMMMIMMTMLTMMMIMKMKRTYFDEENLLWGVTALVAAFATFPPASSEQISSSSSSS